MPFCVSLSNTPACVVLTITLSPVNMPYPNALPLPSRGILAPVRRFAPSTLADVTLTVADLMSKKLVYAAIGVIRTAIVAIPSLYLFLVMESNSTILSKSNIIKNMNNFAEICSV